MKKIIITGLFLIFAILIGIGFQKIFFNKKNISEQKTTIALQPKDGINYKELITNSISENLDKITAKKQVPKVFCKTILDIHKKNIGFITPSNTENKGIKNGNKASSFIYSPYLSLRFYISCKNALGDDFSKYENHFPEIVKNLGNTALEKLKNTEYRQYFDGKGKDKKLFTLEKLIEIYNNLINDYINQKIKNIFLIKPKSLSSQDIEEAIKDFSNTYFGQGNEICNEKDKYFIYKENINTKDYIKNACGHPETYKYLSNIIKNISKNTNYIILDYNTLQKIPNQDPKECKKIFNKNKFTKETLNTYYICSFLSFTDKNLNDLKVFQNILLNEILRYHLYLNYYKTLLSTSPELFSNLGDSLKKMLHIKNDKINLINKELIVSQNSLTKSLKLLYNIKFTFPIHVANKIYYEDLKKYRKQLLKIYTPIHQLYYKLRNVEDLRR